MLVRHWQMQVQGMRPARRSRGRALAAWGRRYFSEGGGSVAEEFAGLRPGALSRELRAALGVAETAPPPWLARMRALGYPPGYRSAFPRHG